MKNVFILTIIILFTSCSEDGSIIIDSAKKLHTASVRLNGANMEDLNFQFYGGLYSQLLYGQDFEEHVDVDFLNLSTRVTDPKITSGPLRYTTFVMLDENGKPYLSNGYRGMNPFGNPVIKPYELNSKNISDNFRPLDSLSKEEQKQLLERVNGDRQISRYWNEINSGNAKGVFKLVNKGMYLGRRDQFMKFVSGSGEVGLDNMGLMRQGINFQEGKNYEGLLRVKNPGPCDLFVALLSADGTEKLAEKAIRLNASPNTYQKVEFDLIPAKSETRGRFAVILKTPAEITLGYAFLQPGVWGRVKGGYPIRQDFIDQLKANGMSIIRYNGAMNSGGPDGPLYRWKNMTGPRDKRVPYAGTFNPYATHSFGIFEFLMVAEAAGVDGVVGISKDEDPTEIKNMIEYAKGPVTTKWGAMRAEDGHPEPFNLKYIEIGNEQRASGNQAKIYFDKFKILASEIWEADSSIIMLVSINVSPSSNPTIYNLKKGDDSNQDYNRIKEFLSWVKEQGKDDRFGWDSHYNGSFESDTNVYNRFGLNMQDVVAADLGFKLKLYALEENGYRHTFNRGLSHALMQNRLNRWGDRIEAAATANLFQPEIAYFTWNQGRIFYDSYRFWNQASGIIDQMYTKEWLPWVLDVKEQAPTDSLDILVKASEDGKVVSMYVVNFGFQAKERDFLLPGFVPKSDATISQLGPYPMDSRNSSENPNLIKEEVKTLKIRKHRFAYQFAGHSFTVIRMELK